MSYTSNFSKMKDLVKIHIIMVYIIMVSFISIAFVIFKLKFFCNNSGSMK